jgi:hypothetical protein
MLVGEFLRISDAKKSSSSLHEVFCVSVLQIAESQPDVSNCCKSHECPLSFMASDSERKKIFRFTDARRRVLEHFELKNQHLIAADGFLPAIFAFFK